MYRIKSDYHLVLASGSPRRKELLSGLGLEFEVVVSGCNEDLVCGEPAKEMVERLACEKANFVANARPRSWVLGADTTVAIGEQILGKPRDTREAFQMLQQLQGREHLVWGAFCIVHAASNRQELRSDVTKVRMRP
ncbi:MAG: Maf family protein, partial [Bdellovibrionales bacterium]|nr:Maf family protein [Bdellovibrionales bacterium]